MKHWIVMVGLCGLAISAVGLPVMTNGVFIQPIADSLGVYRGSVAMHNTMTLVTKALMSLYITHLLKRYPFKLLLGIGIILAGVSNVLLGFSQAVWLFNVLGTLRGIGAGMIAWVPITIIVNEWFEEKHGLIMSLVLSFSSVAGAVFSPVFTTLIEQYGWERSYQMMGVTIILFALPALFTPFTINPRESGLLPYGHIKKENQEEDDEASRSKVSLAERTDVNGLLFAGMFLFTLLQTLLIGMPQHFPGFAGSLSLSNEVGATMLSVAMISSVVFKLAMGYISDQVGVIKSSLNMIAIVGIASLLLAWVETPALLYGAAFLFGGVFSIPSVSVTLLTKEFFGRYNFARLFPIISFSTSIGGAISLSLVGFIYDFTGSYIPAFLMAAGITLFNLTLLLYMKRMSGETVQQNT